MQEISVEKTILFVTEMLSEPFDHEQAVSSIENLHEIDVNVRVAAHDSDYGTRTLFNQLAATQKWKAVDFMLEYCNSLNINNVPGDFDDEISPLFFALMHKKYDLAVRLMKMGADMQTRIVYEEEETFMPVYFLATKNLHCFQLLLDNCWKSEEDSKYQWVCALHYAVQRGYTDMPQRMMQRFRWLSFDQDPDWIRMGPNLLFSCLLDGRPSIRNLRWVLDQTCKCYAKKVQQMRVAGSTKQIWEARRRSTDINKRNFEQGRQTVVCYASSRFSFIRISIIKMLVEKYHANPFIKDVYGKNAVDYLGEKWKETYREYATHLNSTKNNC